MTFDLKFGYCAAAMDSGKVSKFHYFIASISEDIWTAKVHRGSKMTPSVLLVLKRLTQKKYLILQEGVYRTVVCFLADLLYIPNVVFQQSHTCRVAEIHWNRPFGRRVINLCIDNYAYLLLVEYHVLHPHQFGHHLHRSPWTPIQMESIMCKNLNRYNYSNYS